MNAKEALDYLYQATVIEPTVADETMEETIEVIRRAINLSAKALEMVEWHTWESYEYCIWCGVGKHLDHYNDCPRQLALFVLGEKDGT